MWSAVALAVVFAAWRFAVLAGAAINVAAATTILVKLAGAGNLDRARKLCRAAPRSPYFIALGEALSGDGESREIRRARFDDAFALAMAPLEGGRWMDLAALGAGVAAAFIAATSPNPPIPAIVLGAAAALIALRNRRAVRRMRTASLAAVPGVLDAVTASSAGPPPAALARVTDGAPAPAATGRVLVLTASVDGAEIARASLDREVVKVGRLSSAHLHLDHPSVSRMHAVIETSAAGSTLIDLGSAEGTRVNGERINKAVIADGDEIQIGQVIVQVSSGAGVPVATRAAPPPTAPPEAPARPAPAAAGVLLDLRDGTCPICGGRDIAERPAVAGDLVPWVCGGCGYAQLYAPRG